MRLTVPGIVAAAIAVAVAALAPTVAIAQPRAQPRVVEVAVVELPREARDTLRLIRAGGPFPYERDGVRFGNREKMLPTGARDYYREYTVPTPGAKNRGARRIVCGGPPRTPEACYYTADHYQSFARIRE
jgi:ribonuclease T1